MIADQKAIQDMQPSDLETLYTEAYEPDKRIFSEMRTNLQLISGEHYVKEGSRFWNRIRDDKQLTNEQRLKLTKNHIQRVTKIYRNQIESASPEVAIVAAIENDLSSQKAAELNYSYWQYVKECENVEEKRSLWIKNFIEIGEVCVKIFWQPDAGKVVGYEPEMEPSDPNDPESDLAMKLDEQGNPIASDNAVWGGKLSIDTFEAYMLRRDPSVRTMDESPYLILGKVVSNKAVQAMLGDDREKIKKLQDTPQNEWTIFDNNTNTYRAGQNQVLVKEIYWRPAPSIPKGYYYIYTSSFIISQGELPGGIFPIITSGFDEQTGNPRCHSVIRHIRPPQLEINRCASKMAEHQITLGDDKVLMPANAKLGQGSLLPGIRVTTFTGPPPTIMAGRSGEQYMGYLEAQISELYTLANLPEVVEDQPDSSDPYTNLMRSYRFKKKFEIYGAKFERFYKRVVETSLAIAKVSISDAELIQCVGKNETINIPEFKSTSDNHYRIKVQPRSDDIETQFGKQLVINHAMQYVGSQLDKSDIGQLMRNSPWLNDEKMFQKFTQPYDRVKNDILALDRGIPRSVRPFDDHDYIIGHLTMRMSQPDYEYLDPRIQQLYDAKLADHEQAKAIQMQQIQRAQSGFIPSGGYMVTCDLYTPTPTAGNPNSVSRIRVPSEALDWLIKKLQDQGNAMQSLLENPPGAVQQIAQMMPSNGAPPQPQPQPQAVGGQNAQ